MKLVACMPVRNEEWILGLSARVALLWNDAIVFYVHASTDHSFEIACQLYEDYGPERVLVIRDVEQIWDEMQHRQRMLVAARQMGATHISIVDADEILTGNLIEQRYLSEQLTGLWNGNILQLPGYNLRGGIDRYHSSGIWSNRWFSVAFADDPRLGWKGDKFHSREPSGLTLNAYRPIAQGQGGVMHLWGASERRLKAKHAWYKIAERLRWTNKSLLEIETMYNWAIKGRQDTFLDQPCDWKYKPVPESWWAPYAKWMQYMDIDAEPWQERYVREAVAKHGADTFKGLDLFGVEK